MKKSALSILLLLVFLSSLFFSGCAPAATLVPTSVPPTFTLSPIPPTLTREPTATVTATPLPTPLPGSVVVPIETLGNSIPWLPFEEGAYPNTYIIYFNMSKPPFDNVLTRQAFAAATDRETVVEVALKYFEKNPRPATSFTPPETLGRDLYNQVGIPFNPTNAKDLLIQAGYEDPSKFPPVTFLINMGSDSAPGLHVKIADELAKMWQQNLGIKVTVEVVSGWNNYMNRIESNQYDMFRLYYDPKSNDPDSFLREGFGSSGQGNLLKYSNDEFDRLVNSAANSSNPARRQDLYIRAERILCEKEVAILPIYFVSY